MVQLLIYHMHQGTNVKKFVVVGTWEGGKIPLDFMFLEA